MLIQPKLVATMYSGMIVATQGIIVVHRMSMKKKVLNLNRYFAKPYPANNTMIRLPISWAAVTMMLFL